MPRPRLMKRLDQGMRLALTLISAPPGFGKSCVEGGRPAWFFPAGALESCFPEGLLDLEVHAAAADGNPGGIPAFVGTITAGIGAGTPRERS